MARPGTCSIGENTGFLKLQGPVSATLLTEIAVNDTPISLSFAPRTVAPNLLGNIINEGSDSTTNTISYLANKYTLVSGVQLCNPVHTGYKLPDQGSSNHSAELYIPFVNNQIQGAYPTTVIFVVPVYQSSKSSKNAAYLQQLIDSNTKVASLQTIFYESSTDTSQVSLAYETCVDLSGLQSNPQYVNLLVYYFPKGISITAKEYASILRLAQAAATSGNILPEFRLPPASRSASSTIRDYRFTDGIRTPSIVSIDGLIYSQSLVSTASSDFKNRFIYYKKPPKLIGKFSEDNCPYYKTTQYKCVPFDKIQDLSGDYVIRGANSLQSLLNTQNNTISTVTSIPQIPQTNLGLIIGGSIAGVVVVIGVLFKILMSLGEEDEDENELKKI